MNLGEFNILVVDDDEVDFHLIKKCLGQIKGKKIITHWLQDPTLFLETIKKDRYDFCILDQMLGVCSGIELLNELKLEGIKLPVIVLTGQEEENLDLKMIRAGAIDYLTKDKVTPLIMNRVISYSLERYRFKRQEEQLVKKLTESHHFESLSRLSGSLAHEFNNLMMIVIGHTEMISEKYRDDSHPIGESLDIIKETSKRAVRLIDQMLMFGGKSKIKKDKKSLTEIVKEMSELLSTLVPENVQLTQVLENDLPVIFCDEAQIRQALLNVVENSIEAINLMDSEGSQIKIETGLTEIDQDLALKLHIKDIPNGDYCYLKISDDGPGIDEKVLDKIFEPFYTTGFIGRGMGLSTVLGVMRAHLGTVYIKSSIGNGCSVQLFFPLTKQNSH